jgi:hypothetical protein
MDFMRDPLYLPLGSTAFQAVDTGKMPVLQKGGENWLQEFT